MQGSVMGKEVGKGTMLAVVAGSGVVVMVVVGVVVMVVVMVLWDGRGGRPRAMEREKKRGARMVIGCILKAVSRVAGGSLNWR